MGAVDRCRPRPTSPPDHARPPTPQAPPAAPTPVPGNIRPRLTSFVGREPELAAIHAELDRFRLVTLTGPGGSGKTRLAEEAALRVFAPAVAPVTPTVTPTVAPDSPDPLAPAAWIVELAPLDDPEAVPGAVLSALRLREINLITREGAPSRTTPRPSSSSTSPAAPSSSSSTTAST